MSRSNPSPLRRLIRALHPDQAPTPPGRMLRTAAGSALVLLLAGALAAATGRPLGLVAPMGAAALLVIAVPNSPLAQPWAVLVGNGTALLVGLGVALLALPQPLAAALALGGAVGLMLALRALHPPAGAVALLPVLAPAPAPDLAATLALDLAVLLGFALVWHRMAGRVYPFRQPDEAPRAAARFSRADLAAILDRLRLSPNIGVADYARLLAAADEIRTAEDRTAGLSCADAAAPPPVLLSPDETLAAARDALLATRSYTPPVAGPDGRLLGVLSQSDLLRAEGTDARRVAEAMTPDPVSLPAEAPLRDALAVLAQGGWRAVPLTDAAGRCTGLLTRADLIAVLSRAPGAAPLHNPAARAMPGA